MNQIEFISETHTYLLNGCIIPSVSEIIRDNKYDKIPSYILDKARDKGVAVHLATEQYDKGLPIDFPLEYTPFFLRYLEFRNAIGDELWIDPDERESIVYTNDYAGTIDIVGTYKNKTIIADVKTTSKLYKDSIALQLGAYIYAHSQLNEDSEIEDYVAYVVWLKKDKWEFVEITPNVDGFLEKLEEWKARQDNGLDKQFTF